MSSLKTQKVHMTCIKCLHSEYGFSLDLNLGILLCYTKYIIEILFSYCILRTLDMGKGTVVGKQNRPRPSVNAVTMHDPRLEVLPTSPVKCIGCLQGVVAKPAISRDSVVPHCFFPLLFLPYKSCLWEPARTAQLVKAFAVKPNSLTLIPGPTWEKRELPPTSCLLTSTCASWHKRTCAHTCTQSE